MATQYEYTTSLYAQNYLLSVNTTTFMLNADIKTVDGVPITTRPLTRIALYGYNDIRVYASDLALEEVTREFGTYTEIGDVVFNIDDIDFLTDTFIIDTGIVNFDAGLYFAAPDEIRIADNTTTGITTYTVASATNSTITITGTITPNTDPTSGNISNITTPIHPEDGDGFTFVNGKNITVYVAGIVFPDDDVRPAGTNIRIIVGEAAVNEIGSGISRVRMIENDDQYEISGDTTISLTSYRVIEQIKTKTNQYPLFDVFDVEGEPAYTTNQIFGYKTSSEAEPNIVGERIVHDAVNDIYSFDQFLLEEDNGELFAYRDYANKKNDYWFNKETGVLRFWDDITWNDKTLMSEFYRRAIINNVEPNESEREIDGLYWYNTATDTLFKRFIDPLSSEGSWNEITGVDQSITDVNLQTIWKAGTNNDMYVPDQVDWHRRSEAEYNDERTIFITNRTNEILAADPTISEIDAILQATTEWYESQSNHISSTGAWVGDWEIPDPLYFNHLHENRKYLDSRELLAHFTTIINEQPPVPGWTGTKPGQYNITHINDVNYALGGTIKEYNNGFDTLISSVMVNNVTPRSLIEFAHDQYEGLLNIIKEVYRKNSVDVLVDVSAETILNLSSTMAEDIIHLYELNDNVAFLYGDSTTFTDNEGDNDLGVRSWIATLPYINLVHRTAPERLVDSSINLNEVVHHDSHRGSYEITDATADVIAKTVIETEDPRLSGGTLGVASLSLPADNIAEFVNEFTTILSREGVYWHHNGTSPSVLYRYVVASSGIVEPSSAYGDGTLWMDLSPTAEVLRIKTTDDNGTVSWDVVDGLIIGDGRLHNGTNPADVTTATISAWQVIDLNTILGDIIYELETRLYENAPDTTVLNYDFNETKDANTLKYSQYLNEAFLSYVSQSEIDEPFKNVDFDAELPFTWNYKRSVMGADDNILLADDLTNSFVINGNRTAAFAASEFYVKNSIINDGTWKIITSTYDAGSNTTTFFVEGDVKDGVRGSIYSGILPSPIIEPTEFNPGKPNNLNDGSESGGDWRDLYEKFYGTPYPHLEPWILQGYTSKPDWWDGEYLNDDISKWGSRTWKYKHGFDVVGINATKDTIEVDEEFISAFVSSTIKSFDIDNSDTHAGDYIIKPLDVIQSVAPGDAEFASFIVDDSSGFASSTYFAGMKIAIAKLVSGVGTIVQNYTIQSTSISVASPAQLTIVVEEEILAGDIDAGVDFINGSIYSPITNKTTIYVESLITGSPLVVDGRITSRYGMWNNISLGNIPAGKTYPNGIISVTGIPAIDNQPTPLGYGLSVDDLPTFNYFSVNIDNITVTSDGGITNFAPDEIFPPFWDAREMYGAESVVSINKSVRSLYLVFGNEIIAPNASYVYNDSGPVEWEWKASSQYLYDQLTVAYRIDPAQFIYNTFGFNFTNIGGLLIDRAVKNTASHTRTNFHGDVVDNTQFKSDGLNQWYVNFNRYSGYDTNFSDFSLLWTLWEAPLTYQFASYIDTPSLSVGHRYIDLTAADYNITSKKSPGVEDFWLDALKIQILNIPYDLVYSNNQLEWRFDMRTNIPQSREIEYYDVHNYQYYADTATNECRLYTWDIESVDAFNNEFTIVNDHADIFAAGRQFIISNSSGNNDTYTIESSSYDTITKLTTIAVDVILASPVADGIISLVYRNVPWETGFGVYLSTTVTMPIPLESDTIIGTTKYFIIKTSDTTFKIANTHEDAINGIEIPLTSQGIGDQYVGELLSTFTTTASTNVLWRHYAIDKSNMLSWSTPKEIQGMQHMIDIIRGYDAFTNDSGWVINADRSLRDATTDTIVTWQVEIERFIAFAYSTRSRRSTLSDRYPVTVDDVSDDFTFTSENKSFITGDPVVMFSSNAVYPNPISPGLRYYVIRDTLETFKLATSRVDAEDGTFIDILPTSDLGDLVIFTPTEGKLLVPEFELNPFRNAIWFNPPSGIVSNVITGPVEDIRTTQLIFNQNGDTIEVDQLRVYRSDKQTKISILDAINPEINTTFLDGSYNFLHLGGLHIFTDSYEHAMIFNNYSAGDNLLYDPFIGLNVTKYEMLFNRNPEFTGRPNVGGYYLETFFNQGANIKDNFEAGVENLRNAYDTYDTLESNLMTTHARDGLGYTGSKEYLTNLNVSAKSQFIFWRGQIQAKGSVNAIKAYINSRRFIDAKVDEFWAIKVADFGSTKEKEYPEMFATTVDARTNEFKVEFIDSDDDGSNVSEGFTAIKMSDSERWYNQPEQVEVLRNNGKVMYFDMKIVNKLDGTPVGSPLTSPIVISNGYINHGLNVDVVSMTLAGDDFTAFEYINPYIIKMTGSPLPNVDDLTIWGYVANNNAQNPSRLIDRDAETHLSTIEFWDPDRGHHYSNAIHNVDMQNATDPAIYVTTPTTTTDTYMWTRNFIGTSWMDTSTMYYAPYHSSKVITDDSVRFREWGQLLDFARINIYEWVESDVLPSAWDGIAETEAGDNTIPEDQRKSGVAKLTLFEPVDAGSPTTWKPLKDKVDTQYAALVSSGIFTIDLSVMDNSKAVDVYINESKQTAVQPTGSPAILPVTVSLTVKENDIVRFVQAVPADEEFIALEVAAGNLLQEYEYTTVEEIDTFGAVTNKYYFWVGSKSTKPLDRNRLMSLAEAEQQLVTIPNAHMFFQKPLPSTINTATNNLVDRVEYFNSPQGSPINVINVELPFAAGTFVFVDVNGVDIDQSNLDYNANGTSTEVTINVPVFEGSPLHEVRITYTGIYDIDTNLPHRFSQVIIRGLQGIVFDDSRYTIRFTRDFTLRDHLDVEDETIGPLDLNNLHEEWKIFRREQDVKVDRWMWDKITESMVGHKLADSTIRVPSFEHELYDEKFETDTQYGLGENQAFVNGTLAASSILVYLIDPEVSFTPIDINVFFSDFSFDTSEEIIAAMDAIYNTFTISNVNRMYFSVLFDAFTTKAKYPGIFKTSMVSLHGIRPFQSSGVFDD